MQHEQRILLSTVASFIDSASKTCRELEAASIFGVASKLQISAIALQLEGCSRGLCALCTAAGDETGNTPSSSISAASSPVGEEIESTYLSEEQEKLLEKIFGADDNVDKQ